MRKFARGVALAALAGMVGGPMVSQAFGQEVVEVKDAPVHKIDAGAEGPVEPLSPPGTLNAQFAAEKVSAEKVKVEKTAAKDLKVVPLNAPPPEPPAAKPAAAPKATVAKAEAAPAPKPVAVARAEPPKAAPKPASARPEGPSVAFAPGLIDAAGAFGGYVTRAGAIDAKFKNGAAIGQAVAVSSAYETHQFQEGMVAYAALVALQEPGFVQAVWNLGRDARDRDELAKALLADPQNVLGIDRADEAAATVSGVLAQMGADLVKAGQGSRKAAYDVQKEAWSSEAAPDPQKRLADAKTLSNAKSAMTEEDTAALLTSLVALRKAGPPVGGRAPAPTPVVARGLALAALAVLGKAGDEDIATLQPLLTDAKSEDCMKMAKLNLYQCLAVAGPHYEHAFCLGQHALMDTGQCVIGAAGQSPIPAELPVTVQAAVKKSRSISVPIALDTPAGPERSLAYARPQPGEAQSRADAAEPEAAVEPSAEVEEAPRALAVAPPPPQVRREAPREAAQDDRYANGDRYADEDDRYAEEEPAYREPQRPIRRAERDDRYAPYNPYQGYQRDPREYRQDYDPYASPYYGRTLPPGYAYRFGR